MDVIVETGIGTYVLMVIVIVLLLALIAPGRWFLAEIWNEIIKPIFIRLSPRIIHWLYESHVIIIKNFLPRSVVIKTLKAKYQSKNRK